MPARTASAKRRQQRAQSSSAPAHAFGRSLGDFQQLSPAEQILLASCRQGEPADIGACRPDAETEANCVRAAFIRFLALGGDADNPIHERGVRLGGAWVTGELDLSGATVSQKLILLDCVLGPVEAVGAHLIQLNLGGSLLTEGLSGDGLVSHGPIYLRNGFHAIGEVRLLGARIEGDLDCHAARFEAPKIPAFPEDKGKALTADGAHISGHVFMGDGFYATGDVRLVGAVIGGSLQCEKGRFETQNGEALYADGVQITGDVQLSNEFHALGEVRFLGARIGGDLACNKGRFEGLGKDALAADRAEISGCVFLCDGFHATGRTRLLGAIIHGNLECHLGCFEALDGEALFADGARISGDLFLRRGFHAIGHVRIVGAWIGGDLDCTGARIEAKGNALTLERTRVDGGFFFQSVNQLEGYVLLDPMRAGSLHDDAASWALAPGRLLLDGFVYDRLSSSAPTDAATRIAWLDSQRPIDLERHFKPQPWEQLIVVLRAMGHPEEARTIAVAKQDRLRKAGKIVRGAQTLHRLYGLMVGYGYRPMRLLRVTASVWLLCAALYWAGTNPQWFGAETHLLAPPSSESGRSLPVRDYTNFVPLVYSADVLLPVVKLGYKEEWRPVVADALGESLPWGVALRYVYWFEIAFGWVAGVFLVGVLGNLIKKD